MERYFSKLLPVEGKIINIACYKEMLIYVRTLIVGTYITNNLLFMPNLIHFNHFIYYAIHLFHV